MIGPSDFVVKKSEKPERFFCECCHASKTSKKRFFITRSVRGGLGRGSIVCNACHGFLVGTRR